MPLSRRQLIGSGVGLGAALGVGALLRDAWASNDAPPKQLRQSEVASGTRFPGDPGPERLFYGANVMPGLSMSDLEDQLDHRLTLNRTYFNAAQVDALVTQVSDDHDAARLPVVSTKLPGTWAQVAQGQYDDWLQDLLTRLGAATGPVMLSLHHEPENDVTGDGMTAADWVALQNRAISAADGTTVTILPVLMAWTFRPESGRDPSEWWVPGASVIGIDCYNAWSLTNGAPWMPFEDLMAPARAYAGDLPLLVGEYGCRTPPGDPERAGVWMRDAFEYAYRNDIVGLAYFDSSLNSPDGSWVLDDVRTRAMRECIGKPQVVQLS